MAGIAASDPVKNICAIVEERDKKIFEKEIKTKYYKNLFEKLLEEIKYLENEHKKIDEEDQCIQKQLNQLEFIQKSIKESQEVTMESLKNHQALEKYVEEDLKIKKKETQRTKEEFQNLYIKTKETLMQNPLYQELEKERVKFLKLDIQHRDLQVKIKIREKIIKQKRDVQKKIYYNFFINMAEDYLIEIRSKELEKLKVAELKAVTNLYLLQEEVKKKQKLGITRDKIKMTNITFGTQECSIEKPENKIEPTQKKKEPILFNEKLNNMFQQDETKNVAAPSKVRILNQRVIIPAFVAPDVTVSDKRKSKTIDMSRKWHNLMKKSSISTNRTKDCNSLSQQSDKILSQGSQQSQPSQRSQMSQQSCDQFMGPQTVLQEHTTPKSSMMQSRPISIPDVSTNPNVPLYKSNIVSEMTVSENNKSVRFNLEPTTQQTDIKSKFGGQIIFSNVSSPFVNQAHMQSEIMAEPSENCEYPIDHTDENKVMFQTKESLNVLDQIREKVPLAQYHMTQSQHFGPEKIHVENSQASQHAPREQILPISGVQSRPISDSDMVHTKSNIPVSKSNVVSKMTGYENNKSVRFNLEPRNQQTDNKPLFAGQSVFGNAFNPFSNQTSMQNENLEQDTTANNGTFNISLMDVGETSRLGFECSPGDNERTVVKSPEFSYEVGTDTEQPPFKTPGMTPFGEGAGFFSFRGVRNLFNPF